MGGSYSFQIFEIIEPLEAAYTVYANVPPWAMKVVLDEEEFAGPAARSASALAEAMSEEDDLYRDLNNS